MVIKAIEVTPSKDGKSTSITFVMTTEEAEHFMAGVKNGAFAHLGLVDIEAGPKESTDEDPRKWAEAHSKSLRDPRNDKSPH